MQGGEAVLPPSLSKDRCLSFAVPARSSQSMQQTQTILKHDGPNHLAPDAVPCCGAPPGRVQEELLRHALRRWWAHSKYGLLSSTMALITSGLAFPCGPAASMQQTWTTLQHDGPNDLGLCFIQGLTRPLTHPLTPFRLGLLASNAAGHLQAGGFLHRLPRVPVRLPPRCRRKLYGRRASVSFRALLRQRAGAPCAEQIVLLRA